MKLKRFIIYRPEFECMTDKPICARLHVMLNYCRFVSINKTQPTMNDIPCCKPFWMLTFPKIKYTKVSHEEMKQIISR